MFEALMIGLVVATALICLGEAYYERDWPRDTIKYFLLAVFAFLIAFRVV